MTRKIVKISINLVAVMLGILGGFVFFTDLLPLNRASGFNSVADYMVFGADVFFSLIACILAAVFAKFILWDCAAGPFLENASRRRKQDTDKYDSRV